ncbi:PIN domain-containing protein [Capilliphycus salinus ALCB114379]|uniref:PIN domain-containing protein n=1 Tax=Capilliphycus salinus TaxID=2768948 RepID=UPI0039A6DEDB
MIDYIRGLLQQYKQKGILVDTNILLLLFVGTVNPNRIEKFKRTQQFNKEDYQLLSAILKDFSKIVVTPNILTEVNSFINQLSDPERSECLNALTQAVNQLDESYIKSKVATQVENFTKFGLTDCGIIHLARDSYLVLTDDLKLANYLQKIGIDAINFNNIRGYGWK